jgi:hypothetical protein
MTLMGTLITLKKKTRRVLPKIVAFTLRLLIHKDQKPRTMVHIGHMGTQLRFENTNTRLQVPMEKTPEWCEHRQLRTHTG